MASWGRNGCTTTSSAASFIGSVPTTPDPNTSAKACIVIQIGGVYTTFCHREGIHLQKYAIEMGGVSRYFFTCIGVRGRFDSPDFKGAQTMKCTLSAKFREEQTRLFLKFPRVTIRGAQPSARLSEEICLSEGSAGVSPRALRGLSEGSAGSLRGPLRGSAGFSEGFGGSDPMLVTLGKCWTGFF